jgi:hypothetical protein
MAVDMNPDIADRITATIPEFRRLSGIGRSRIYELLDAGEIESIYLGTRRLILIDSYRRLIERQRGRRPAASSPDPRAAKVTAGRTRRQAPSADPTPRRSGRAKAAVG